MKTHIVLIFMEPCSFGFFFSSVFWTLSFTIHTVPYHHHRERVTSQQHRLFILWKFQVYF